MQTIGSVLSSVAAEFYTAPFDLLVGGTLVQSHDGTTQRDHIVICGYTTIDCAHALIERRANGVRGQWQCSRKFEEPTVVLEGFI